MKGDVGVCAALDDYMATGRERETRLAFLTEILTFHPVRLTFDEVCDRLGGEYYDAIEVGRAFSDLVRFEVLHRDGEFVAPGTDALCLLAVMEEQDDC